MPNDTGTLEQEAIRAGVPSPLAECVEPLALTNAFIERFGAGNGISHMKLQKLSYYTHAWWLSHYDQPFLCERPEVWKYGPVFAHMYQDLKGFGSLPIAEPQSETPFGEPPIVQHEDLDRLIEWVWAKYGGMTAAELSTRTHAPGTPWRIIAEKYKFSVPMHMKIDDDIVKRCFRRDVQEVLHAQ